MVLHNGVGSVMGGLSGVVVTGGLYTCRGPVEKDPDVFLLTDFSKVQWNLSLHVGDEDGVLES